MHTFVGITKETTMTPPAAAGATTATTAPVQQIDVQASQDPSHPQHSFHLGQVMATGLLALSALQKAKSAGADVFLDPAVAEQYLTGLTNIWVKPNA